MKKICLLIIGVLFILISCSPSDKETDNGDIENEYILTHSDAYYNDVLNWLNAMLAGECSKLLLKMKFYITAKTKFIQYTYQKYIPRVPTVMKKL